MTMYCVKCKKEKAVYEQRDKTTKNHPIIIYKCKHCQTEISAVYLIAKMEEDSK